MAHFLINLKGIGKLNHLNSIFIGTVYGIKNYNKCSKSFGLDADPQSFCYSLIVLSIMHCSKSAQKFAVRVCQVATVVIETMKLVLSRFKNFIMSILSIE